MKGQARGLPQRSAQRPPKSQKPSNKTDVIEGAQATANAAALTPAGRGGHATAQDAITSVKRRQKIAPPAEADVLNSGFPAAPMKVSRRSAALTAKQKAANFANRRTAAPNGSKAAPKLLKNVDDGADGMRGEASVGSAEKPARPLRKPRPTKVQTLPEGYRPAEHEDFMNTNQQLYFRNRLLAWKDDILRSTRETLHTLNAETAHFADLADRATSESDKALELRARDRQRKLISKIDAALQRIDFGTYGYCEETGEPISLKRLDARPIATLSIEAQERHERRERVYRDD